MNERRRHARHVVEGMGIYAKSIFSVEIEVIDISVSGCSIRSAKRLNMAVEYLFKFEHSQGIISIKGKVVWEKLSGFRKTAAGENIPVYTAGIQFSDVTEKENITNFIREKMKGLEDDRFRGIRVRIEAAEKAVLSYLDTSAVRDISLGGIQIETAQEPPIGVVFSMEIIFAKPSSSVLCKGRIAFCYEIADKAQRRYRAGVELIDISEPDRLKLERFIEKLPPPGS